MLRTNSNLLWKMGLNEIGNSVSRKRGAVKYIKHSPSRVLQFQTCGWPIKKYSKNCFELKCPNRWNPIYFMLEIVLKYQKSLWAIRGATSPIWIWTYLGLQPTKLGICKCVWLSFGNISMMLQIKCQVYYLSLLVQI